MGPRTQQVLSEDSLDKILTLPFQNRETVQIKTAEMCKNFQETFPFLAGC